MSYLAQRSACLPHARNFRSLSKSGKTFSKRKSFVKHSFDYDLIIKIDHASKLVVKPEAIFKWVINIHICRAVPNVPHGCRIQEQSLSKSGETFSTRKWLKTCLTKTLLHLIIKSDHAFVKEVDQT